ncbi:unnamed protein product [Larinioides sclopetarius]|uniref:Reverse transcriptase domain-containing protein n=1 Tax=Larinioides sclopetarius TaxID=280406 RepID=A0AAV2B4J8_9ARAC
MSKVLDKLVTQRILHHYYSGNIMNPLQHGFRANKSCETAGYDLKSLVLEKTEGNLGVCMISLDVAGAFDNVCWESILYLLAKASCPINTFGLVRSYLSDRWVIYETRATRVEHEVRRGCPQGSCSGPLFWNIVADSLLDCDFPANTYIQAYADDLVLVIWGHNKAEIEERGAEAICMIEEWGKLNRLSFSPKKTVMLPITWRNRLSMVEPPEVYIDGHLIQAVKELKYLGVLWDGKLTFHPHFKNRKEEVDSLTYKLSRTVSKWFSKQPGMLKRVYTCALEP